jgi:hypothetical protein
MTMKAPRILHLVVALIAWIPNAPAQGFLNRNFDTTTLTTVHFPGGDRYTATIPGWAWNTPNYVDGDPNSVALNDIALDAPAVTLQGTSSPFFPALQGGYSVLLQGGTMAGGLVTGNTNGASVYQTGQIPSTSLSLTYLGSGSLQVAFNGQILPSVAISNAAAYTVWGVDISAYAGQSGELRFTSPWLAHGVLDDIRFSSTAIPEPETFSLACLGLLCLLITMRRLNPGAAANRRPAGQSDGSDSLSVPLCGIAADPAEWDGGR